MRFGRTACSCRASRFFDRDQVMKLVNVLHAALLASALCGAVPHAFAGSADYVLVRTGFPDRQVDRAADPPEQCRTRRAQHRVCLRLRP
jgi:hypothetical protein